MQASNTEEEFSTASSLFLKKWSTNEAVKLFLSYFEEQYLKKRNSWYEEAAPRFPSTNNGPESINAQIKRDGTLRQRLPLRDFFNCIFKIVKNWSVDRDPASPNFKAFAATPSLHTKILSES